MGRKKKDAQRASEFEALLTPHLEALYATALRLTRSPEEAEDLVQDAALKAFRFLDRYQRGTHFRAWIFKILMNTFNSRYRKAQRDREMRPEIEQPEHLPSLMAQGPQREALAAEEAILDRMMSAEIQAALAQLSPEFRVAVILSDVEEFTYKEIAEIMDCPVGTVMSRLYRGRRQLQQRLLGHARDRGLVAPEEVRRQPDSQGAEIADLAAYRSRGKR